LLCNVVDFGFIESNLDSVNSFFKEKDKK